jgi:uncharacterized protein (DUF305 family)
MHDTSSRQLTLIVALALAGCGGAPRATSSSSPPAPATEAAPAPRPALPHTAADVAFMTGMIHHHAQAVLMASWAPTHGASPSLQALCERILVGQRDEIATMQSWLRDAGEPVPDADATHTMHGMQHGPMMPGMLTAEQLQELDRARGAEFDRLFLTYMIRHHEGAIVMVNELFKSPGAAQDEDIFKFASDVNVDQMTEIERMTQMLAALTSPGGNQ